MTPAGPTVLVLLETVAERSQLNCLMDGDPPWQGQLLTAEWAAIAPALSASGGDLPGVPHRPDLVVLMADCFEHHWPQLAHHWSPGPPAALVLLPTVDDDRAAQLLAAGAADYLHLPHWSPTRLGHSLRQLWQQCQCQVQLAACETYDVFGQAAIAMNMADASGRFLRVNPQFCALLGYTEAELLRLHYQDITHPDDLNAQLEQERRLFAQEQPSCTFEKRYLTKDGTPMWTRVTLSTVCDRAGNPISDLAVVENIDDRKRLEQALQASQAQLADVLSSSQACITRFQLFPDGTWVYDYYSPGSQVLYGYSSETLRSNPKLWASRVVPADFQAVVMPAIEAILAGRAEEIGDLEFRFCHRDGSVRWIQESCTVRWDGATPCWWVTTVGVDISDRKRLEAEREQALVALQRSEAKLLEAQQLAHLGHWEWLPQTGESWWSSELMDIFGFDVSGQGPTLDAFITRVHPEDWPHLNAAFDELLAQGTPQRQQHRIVLPDGTVRHMLWQGQAVFDPQGRVVKLFGIAQDVTEAKQTELALEASERKHRALVRALPDLIIRMDGAGQYLDFFAASDMVVLDGEALVGKNIYEQGLPQPLADRRMAAIQAALATGELQHYEQELFNGQESVTEEVRIVPTGDNQVLVIVRNISDRKRAEAALRTREQQLQMLVDALPFGVWVRDGADRLVLQNRVDVERFGQQLGSIPQELENLPQAYRDRHPHQLTAPGDLVAFERWETVRGESRYFQRLEGILPDMAGGMGMFGAYLDITERQRTEQALRENQAQLAKAQAIAQVGSWEFDLTTQVITWSAEMFRIYGLDPIQPEPTYGEFQALVHPDDWPTLDAAIERAIATGQPYAIEHRIRRPDGTLRTLLGKGEVLHDEQGRPRKLMGTGQDITDRKAAEQALQQSELLFRSLFEQFQIGVAFCRLEGERPQPIRVNQQLCEMLAYSAEALLNHSCLDLFHPEDLSTCKAAMADLLAGRCQRQSFENRYRRRDGAYVWARTTLSLLSGLSDSEPLQVVLIEDISDRKQAELEQQRLAQVVAEWRDRYEIAAQATGQVLFEYDIARNRATWGPNTDEVLGFPIPAMPQGLEAFIDRIHPDQQAAFRATVANDAHATAPYRIEFQFRRADGTYQWLEERGMTRYNPQGEAVQVIGYLGDIRDRKQTELALQESERRYATLTEMSPTGIFQFNAQGQCQYLNPRWCEITGRSVHEGLGHRWQAALHPEDRPRILAEWHTASAQQAPLQTEGRFLRPDQTTVWFDCQVIPEFDDRGTLVGYVGTVSDITTRKEAELALQQLNAELEARVQQRTAALARSEQDLRTIFNNVYDAIFIQDLNGVILDVNDRALELNGATREQLIGATVEQFSAPHAPVDQLPQRFQQAQAGATLTFEWPCRRFNTDDYFDAEVSLRAAPLGDRQVYLVCVRDISDRKRAEAELQAERLRLQVALDAADMGTWSCTLTPPHLHWSQRAETIFGFTPGTFPHHREAFLALVHPEDLDRVQAAINASFTTGAPYQLEYRIRRLDGQVRWIAVWGTLSSPASGESPALMGVITDITARKQAEENLRNSEERFRQIAENIEDVFWLATPEHQFLYLSPAYTKVWGRSFGDITYTDFYADFLTTVHPEDLPAMLASPLVNTPRQWEPTDRHWELEYRIIRPDGQVRWIHARAFPVYDETGTLNRVAGVAKDITDHKQLAQEQSRLLAILEASPDHIAMVTPDGQTFWNNRQAKIIRGLAPEVDATQVPIDHYHPAWALEQWHHTGLPTAQRQGIWIGESALLNADNEEIPVSQLILAHTNSAGTVEYFSTIMRDISDIKRAEQALRQANAELEDRVAQRTAELVEAKDAAEAASRSKSIFLANMSHELRTPLNAILGFSQLLTQDSTLAPNHLEELKIINRSGEHLLALINDILEMSKIEAGRVTVETTDVNLPQLLDSLTAMLRLKAETKGLSFSVSCPPEVPVAIHTDGLKLRQVLLNLLSNAIKFTPRGSVNLTVSLGHASTQPLRLGHQVTLRFEVQDTGCGIDPAEHDLLFAPFVQTVSGRKTQEGTGLGLPISQEFVRLVGGDLTFSSRLGLGSTFVVHWPVTVIDTPPPVDLHAQQRPIAIAPGQPAYRILIAEDDWASRLLLKTCLLNLGFEVQTACDGTAALNQWETWRPHLIFMDIRMPDMDGLTVTRQIREQEQIQGAILGITTVVPPRTHIIALTAGLLASNYPSALSAGCDAVLRKPIQVDDVPRLLGEQLGVCYEYEPMAAMPPPSLAPPQPMDLAGLPSTWLHEFYEALIRLHQEDMLALVQALPPTQSPLGAALTHHIQEFQYEILMDLVQTALAPSS